MIKPTTFIGLITLALITNEAIAADLHVSSTGHRNVLIELYTSEGCSSCPPAERWLSRLRNSPLLWKRFVPVAFHVDYWNYLGWRDRFSDPRFSKRQSDYERHGYLQTVYTPGVMKNGREWRAWPYVKIPSDTADDAGILEATVRDGSMSVVFIPQRRYQPPLVLNLALLGFNQRSRVTAGENTGKLLSHDFVALNFQQYPQSSQDERFHWALPGLSSSEKKNTAAIALWVTTADDPTPLQAIGGWLK